MATTRRRFLKYLATAAGVSGLAAVTLRYQDILGLLGAQTGSTRTSSSTSTSVEANFPPEYAEFLNWLNSVSKPYVNQPINIALENEITPRALQRRDIDFFTTSQINTQYNLRPYYLHLQDITIMARTQAPTYDVFSVDHQDVSFFKDTILTPRVLSEKYPDLTYGPIRQQDFQPVPWSVLGTYPPSLPGSGASGSAGDALFIPLDMPIMIQFYRDDIYRSQGLSAPKTWDEYFQGVQQLQASRTVPFGTVCEASPDISVVYEFLNHLASFGGRLWQLNGGELTSVVDSDQGVAALQNYARLASYSDPASSTYTWSDITTDLSRSVAGTALLFYDYVFYLNDPLRSDVVGKLGFGENPSGPAGSFSTYTGNGIAVSKYSKHPQAAWLWAQWATALGTQEQLLLDNYHVLPTRVAVVDLPSVKDYLSTHGLPALQVSKTIWQANHITNLIPFPRWSNALETLSYHLSNAFSGKETPKVALTLAAQQINNLGTLTF